MTGCHWPWVKRTALSADNALQKKPYLPVMHAKAHAWHCQLHICIMYMYTVTEFLQVTYIRMLVLVDNIIILMYIGTH